LDSLIGEEILGKGLSLDHCVIWLSLPLEGEVTLVGDGFSVTTWDSSLLIDLTTVIFHSGDGVVHGEDVEGTTIDRDEILSLHCTISIDRTHYVEAVRDVSILFLILVGYHVVLLDAIIVEFLVGSDTLPVELRGEVRLNSAAESSVDITSLLDPDVTKTSISDTLIEDIDVVAGPLWLEGGAGVSPVGGIVGVGEVSTTSEESLHGRGWIVCTTVLLESHVEAITKVVQTYLIVDTDW
jgi:hypothetical protein